MGGNYTIIFGLIVFIFFIWIAITNYEGDFSPTTHYISDLSKDGENSKNWFQFGLVILMLSLVIYILSWNYRDPLDETRLRLPIIVGSFFLISAFLFTTPHNDILHQIMAAIFVSLFAYSMIRSHGGFSTNFIIFSRIIAPLFILSILISYFDKYILEWIGFGLFALWFCIWNIVQEKYLENVSPTFCKTGL